MTATARPRRAAEPQREAPECPRELVREGESHQLRGRLVEAEECFALAVDLASRGTDPAPLATALRHLGIIHHLRGEILTAIHYCERSRDTALAAHELLLAAEATLALANMACEQGRIDDARSLYRLTLDLVPDDAGVAARVGQNLGVVESVQGNLAVALEHFTRVLTACEAAHDVLGRARAYHNIGMVHADRKEWEAAYRAYDQATSLATQGGDYHLNGLCLLNRAEIDLALGRYDAVRYQAEEALVIFTRLDARADMADAFRFFGAASRAMGRYALAESRLRSALENARRAGVPLIEAESCRDLALLCADLGRSDEAAALFDHSLALFKGLGAARDVAQTLEERRKSLP